MKKEAVQEKDLSLKHCVGLDALLLRPVPGCVLKDIAISPMSPVHMQAPSKMYFLTKI